MKFNKNYCNSGALNNIPYKVAQFQILIGNKGFGNLKTRFKETLTDNWIMVWFIEILILPFTKKVFRFIVRKRIT